MSDYKKYINPLFEELKIMLIKFHGSTVPNFPMPALFGLRLFFAFSSIDAYLDYNLNWLNVCAQDESLPSISKFFGKQGAVIEDLEKISLLQKTCFFSFFCENYF